MKTRSFYPHDQYTASNLSLVSKINVNKNYILFDLPKVLSNK